MPAGNSAIQPFPWNVRHRAIWFSRVLDPEVLNTSEDCPAGQAIALVRHPEYPFEAEVDVAARADRGQWLPAEGGLFDLARLYIAALVDRWPALRPAAQALGPRATIANSHTEPGRLDWLPIGWGRSPIDNADDPRRSFWVLRRDSGHPEGRILDRTAVLLAGRVADHPSGAPLAIGGDVGLRVVVHVAVPAKGRARLRISGCTMSRLTAEGATGTLPAALLAALAEPGRASLQSVLSAVQQALGFEAPAVIQAIRTGELQPPNTLRITGEGARARHHGASARNPAHADHPMHQIAFMVDVDTNPPHAVTVLWTQARVGEAHAQPKRAENTTGDRLTQWIEHEKRAAERPPDDQATAVRSDIVVLQDEPSRPGPHPAGSGQPDTFNLDRTGRGAAREHGEALLQELRLLGLVPQACFKLARLPLELRNRARMRGAPDGQAINADVRTRGPGLSACGPWRSTPAKAEDFRPQLSVRFGSATLGQRWQRLDAQRRLYDVQYLSLAQDAHWAWHEFGHVLNYASFGEMEFRFAHSAGDALAAIQNDPDENPKRASRFSSFPDVALPRRHDRQADAGWCWCGRRSMVRLTGLSLRPNRRLGYFEEQLMSSALFRLYRSLGGDSKAKATRRAASAHVRCLIMKAIALLGPDSIVPAYSADHFVSALIDADFGLHDDGVLGPSAGRASKVIRWAYEAQGLYATDDPTVAAEGPGLPPPVDLYIADRRKRTADGGYEPVSLGWHAQGEGPWFATASAVRRQAGHVQVTVHNRGSLSTGKVVVTAWWWDTTGHTGHWADLGEHTAPDVAAAVGHKHSRATVTLPLPARLPAGTWVLVVVGCDGDPPIALPERLPSLDDHHGLSALVALDNNVALALV